MGTMPGFFEGMAAFFEVDDRCRLRTDALSPCYREIEISKGGGGGTIASSRLEVDCKVRGDAGGKLQR